VGVGVTEWGVTLRVGDTGCAGDKGWGVTLWVSLGAGDRGWGSWGGVGDTGWGCHPVCG